jgi:hypothetical protein
MLPKKDCAPGGGSAANYTGRGDLVARLECLSHRSVERLQHLYRSAYLQMKRVGLCPLCWHGGERRLLNENRMRRNMGLAC